MERQFILLFWISIYSSNCSKCLADYTGTDIGYRCKHDAECNAGNGGEFSKCNQDLNICICTINHLGEDKCMFDSDSYNGVCRRHTLYKEPGTCTLECSPKGTKKWKENQDWYGENLQPFASLILDGKTSACYDPIRALNSAPGGIEIKPSTIPNAGLGAFTNNFIQMNTVFGPFKGTFEPDGEAKKDFSYSWVIHPREDEDRPTFWLDSMDIALSNWLRYVNSPTSTAMENMVVLQHEGELYYHAFKSIQPGTEMFIWYGDTYGEILEIQNFYPSTYYHANHGYAGGPCGKDDQGRHCLHDKNTLCTDETCFCIPGTHVKAGMCILDETLGGIRAGPDGSTCKHEKNAECQRGVCVCKNNSSPANGMCRADETFGGRCAGKNGMLCLFDESTECVNGLCACIYGATGIRDKCVTDETNGGRCIGDDGDTCERDKNAECWDTICKCKTNASEINRKCEFDEKLGGKCKAKDGFSCKLDYQAACLQGICVCKRGRTGVNGTCISDGSPGGMCKDGKYCLGQNSVCDATSKICVGQVHQ